MVSAMSRPASIDGTGVACFTHARVIDGDHHAPIDDGYVLVDGDSISDVGAMAALPARRDVTHIDVEGRTVIPGLIDCHAHLVYAGFRRFEDIDRCPVETATVNAVLNAATLLHAGYTTVRDLGTIGNVAVAVRDAVAEGRIPGPRVVASGQIIHPTAGLADTLPACWELGCGGFGVRADGAAEVVKTIRRQIRNGVDNVKLGASGAEGSPHASTWMTTMNADEMTAAVGEAHRWGRTVAVHCQSYEAVKLALRAGADTIEHGTRLDDEAIALFRETGAVLVPTLSTLFSVLELGDTLGLTPKQRDEMAVNRPLWLDSFRQARDAGVPIAAGGDIGNRYPHGTNARELGFLVREGLSPLAAIHAATGLAARALHRADRLGSLAPGKVADLVVVDGDPLADIAILADPARIWLVVQNGRAVAGRSVDAVQDASSRSATAAPGRFRATPAGSGGPSRSATAAPGRFRATPGGLGGPSRPPKSKESET
jgi:imidazolonepropionase-like amidohydrolase